MYYQGSSEIQGDGLQTLYLMNPNFAGGGGYSEAVQQQPANMVILNYATAAAAAAASGNPINFAGISSSPGQQTQQHLVGVPLQASTGSSNSHHELKLNHLSIHNSQQHEVPGSGSRVPHFHHGLWGSLDGGGGGSDSSPSHHHQIHHHHIPSGVVITNNITNNPADVGFHRPTQQGLSLTLSSSQQQQPGYRGSSSTLPMDHQPVPVQTPIGILSPRNAGHENLRGLSGSSSSVSAVSNGLPGLQGAVFGSKYLKAAQQLLDELVSVGNNIKSEKGKEKGKANRERESTVLTEGVTSSQIGQSDSKGTATELTVAQRQELQMKKAKLVSMLDEVEQRYRQYHHQMQIVVASFEQAAGIGSAKSYTQLALQTISKQFRCLKDAISSQIKSAGKSLGEEETSLGGKFEGSRLKFVDQQLRQQRALQQLGMMQNNTWRPQRGLPERAVSVLRAWLFEHFLHPYPKDSDKQMLAKQTGLTRSQVSNWFINARVRLWKPMVEEMYLEETKNHEQDASESNKSPKDHLQQQRNANIQTNQEKPILSHDHHSTSSTLPTSPANNSSPAPSGFGLIGALNMEANAEKNNSKKMRTHHEMQNSPSSILSVDMEMKFGETRKGFNGHANSNGFGVGGFTLGELGQFNPEQLTAGFHGNGVSLTLGLPPSDQNLPLSSNHHHDQQNYLSDQTMQLGGRLETTPHSNMGYEAINFDSRKRFAAQLLSDFVT